MSSSNSHLPDINATQRNQESPNLGDAEIWESLKHAIAASSGFQRWQIEQGAETRSESVLDSLIRRYLRETLETLAY